MLRCDRSRLYRADRSLLDMPRLTCLLSTKCSAHVQRRQRGDLPKIHLRHIQFAKDKLTGENYFSEQMFAKRRSIAAPTPHQKIDVQQIAVLRRWSSPFGFGRAPSDCLPPKSSSASECRAPHLGHNASTARQNTAWTSRYNVTSVPPAFRTWVRFRSKIAQTDRHVPVAGSLPLYFCRQIPHVILLVFVLVSAAIDDKSQFKFKWLRH